MLIAEGREGPEKALTVAQSFIEACKKSNIRTTLRVGIHTGSVLMSKSDPELIGIDALIAGKVEALGVPNKIVISETTKKHIKHQKTVPHCTIGDL